MSFITGTSLVQSGLQPEIIKKLPSGEENKTLGTYKDNNKSTEETLTDPRKDVVVLSRQASEVPFDTSRKKSTSIQYDQETGRLVTIYKSPDGETQIDQVPKAPFQGSGE